MLVCNVSLRPPRSAIAAEIAEVTAALDNLGSGSGQVVFAALVDDPASVGEIVDAYLGEIMLEAASAADVQDAAIPAVYTGNLTEAVTAADTIDASAAVINITWDAATAANVTLSGGNLVVTNNSINAETGARGASSAGKTTGKFYFEVTTTTVVGTAGANTTIGVGTTASTYTAMGNNATAGANVHVSSGQINANSAVTGALASGFSSGNVAGVAVDLDTRKAWFRISPSGQWNGATISHDPAIGLGGFTIPAGTMVPICTFGIGGLATTGNVFTANFGASAFSGAVPSGFTSGWPA